MWAEIESRVRDGGHLVMIGGTQEVVPPLLGIAARRPAGETSRASLLPEPIRWLHVHCATSSKTDGPLEQAFQRLEAELGERGEDVGPSSRDAWMLYEPADRLIEASFVGACNRLAERSRGTTALLLEGLDGRDEPTLQTLAELLHHPGRLRVQLVLWFRETAPPQAWVETIRDYIGEDSIIRWSDELREYRFAPQTIPADAVHVIRAASVVGENVTLSVLARLVELPRPTVLRALQEAADAGVPLADRGDGHFYLPEEVLEAIAETMLPSLRAHWEKRMVEMLSGSESKPPTSSSPRAVTQNSARDEEVGTGGAELPEPTTPVPAANTSRPTARTAPPAPPSIPDPGVPAVSTGTPVVSLMPADPARAADFLERSGNPLEAAERLLQASRLSSERGDPRRAMAQLEQAASLSRTLTDTEEAAVLRARLHLAAASVKWSAAALGKEFELGAVMAEVDAAKTFVDQLADRPELLAQWASLKARVAYDLGEPGGIEEALGATSEACRTLLSRGDGGVAARLLNAQAGLYLQLGDPVQAAHLMTEAHRLFEAKAERDPTDRVAQLEVARAAHLFARLPLHAKVRPGFRQEAVEAALTRAVEALRIYGALGRGRDRARVLETIGRLELSRDCIEKAESVLTDAIAQQEALRDVVGLARSVSALAECKLLAGHPEESISLLGESIALNMRKGSALGIAFNRATLARVEEFFSVRTPPSPTIIAMMRKAYGELESAERVVGRVNAPWQ